MRGHHLRKGHGVSRFLGERHESNFYEYLSYHRSMCVAEKAATTELEQDLTRKWRAGLGLERETPFFSYWLRRSAHG